MISQPEEGKASSIVEGQSPYEKSEQDISEKERSAALDQFLDVPSVPQLDLTDDEKRGVVEMVRLDWDTDYSAVSNYINGRLRDILERYEQDVVKGQTLPFEGSSRISMADIPIAVETVHPRILGAV